MGLNDLVKSALTSIVKENSKDSNFLTSEKNLTITKDELIAKVKQINPAYLEVMETEANIFVRQGLFKGYFKDEDMLGEIIFDIPDWDKFISAVKAFYDVCYSPDCEDEV